MKELPPPPGLALKTNRKLNMVNFMFLTGLRTFQKSCLNANCISSLTRVNTHRMKIVLGYRFYSIEPGDSSENSGKLIQLVVTSLRVDRVAASGLGIARR